MKEGRMELMEEENLTSMLYCSYLFTSCGGALAGCGEYRDELKGIAVRFSNLYPYSIFPTRAYEVRCKDFHFVLPLPAKILATLAALFWRHLCMEKVPECGLEMLF